MRATLAGCVSIVSRLWIAHDQATLNIAYASLRCGSDPPGDLDFSNALRFPPGSHPGILVARLAVVIGPDDVGARVAAAIDAAGSELDGAITIVDPTRVRIFKPGP